MEDDIAGIPEPGLKGDFLCNAQIQWAPGEPELFSYSHNKSIC